MRDHEILFSKIKVKSEKAVNEIGCFNNLEFRINNLITLILV